MSNSRSSNRWWLTYLLRFALILVTIVVAAITIIQSAVLADMEFARPFIHKAMVTGSILWWILALIVLADRFWISRTEKDKATLWLVLLLIFLATMSVVGINIATFTSTALLANTFIWLLLLSVIILAFSQTWSDCAEVAENEGGRT
jgi:hypothetical protein